MIRKLFARLLRRLGFVLVATRQVDAAWKTLLGFEEYTQRSGHLAHRYHAGRRARRLARRMRRVLGGMEVV